MAPPTTTVESAYRLPGAFLFMTITYKVGAVTGSGAIVEGKQHVGVVAYDPNLKVSESFADLEKRYSKESPYIERFSDPGPTPEIFKKDNGAMYYVGEFGGMGQGSRKSPKWDVVTAAYKAILADGLTLIYWNQKTKDNRTNQGVFTAPPNGRFKITATPEIMKIRPGSGEKFNMPMVLQTLEAEKIALHYYATHEGPMKSLDP
ncbi:MAG: hypothetical protein M1840_000882 [Geoglossum simile]|nr:MAG: hypothetical protein M1840_000882 [Geoglossum simile]